MIMYILLFIFISFCFYLKFKPKNIYYYISNGDYNLLKDYIKENPNSVNNNKHYVTPLASAIWHNNYEIIKLLLDNGADPNLLSSDGCGAVHYAGTFRDLKVLKLLEEYDADFNQLTNYNVKYVREIKPFYELQYFTPEYLLENKDKIMEYINFYKNNFKKNNIDLKLHSWMLDFDALLKNSRRMCN